MSRYNFEASSMCNADETGLSTVYKTPNVIALSRAKQVVVVVVVYPTPSEGSGHGGRPWSPKIRATPQGLDQRS